MHIKLIAELFVAHFVIVKVIDCYLACLAKEVDEGRVWAMPSQATTQISSGNFRRLPPFQRVNIQRNILKINAI